MPNTILTPKIITRESLRILHQECNFLGNVNRQYDDRFAVSGAKIGQLLDIRMPAKYTVREGPTLTVQDHVERSTPLWCSSQIGCDVKFSTVDLTMDLDLFSERVLQPQIKQLAATIEAKCMEEAYKLVSNYTNGTSDKLMTYRYFHAGGKNITNNLGYASDRTSILSPDSVLEFVDGTKAFFHDSNSLKKQWREGMLTRTGGFDVYENTLLPVHTNGTLSGSPVTNGANLGTSATTNVWVSETVLSITDAALDTTLLAGDIITLDGVYEVHPETKAKTGRLKNFVVQEDVLFDVGATPYPVTVKPGLIYGSGNSYQNCELVGTADTDGLAVTRIGIGGNTFSQDLQFHKDAFVFATADLEDVSKYGAWGSRLSSDGISMRIAKQWDPNTDQVPCRVDVLYGFGGLYPELANRHMYEQGLILAGT